MAAAMPKQYLPLNGKPTIAHCLQTFFSSSRIASVHVALSPEDDFWSELISEITQVSEIIPEAKSRFFLHRTGGDSRADTVLNTLVAMRSQVEETDWILVHDAARPGLSVALLDHLLDSLEHDAVGGLLALPLADTLKQSHAGANSESKGLEFRVQKTIPREALWQAQTPQMFRYALLKSALENFNGAPTDEAQAVEALGLQPKLVVGSVRNMKITYPQDITLMEALMQIPS
ncbi:2-C-methyl-D-erythritol 4-phosphate cytidylyltransferase [mine drainage metagenome]|uniref:2-C-methyl-D-erythritol 4-phosphate cytidylyltransferase n=1 Tax=mine drainage metagenome TaxID=410659 RepID=A0A1J5SWN5_9ZZZZ